MSLTIKDDIQSKEQILESKKISLDVLDAFLGRFIGHGAFRNVYESEQDSTSVIKIELNDSFQNVIENEIWERVKYVDEVAKWFAPVKYISECGTVLIMAKCQPLGNRKVDKIPSFFTDVKDANFGIYKGRVVCLDYGSTLLMEAGMKIKLVKYRPF